MIRSGPRRAVLGLGLSARLFAAMALVVAAGAGTLLVVALLIAPHVFEDHLRRAGLGAIGAAARTHVDDAFAQAVLLSLGVGGLVAVLAAGLVSWLVSRRLAAPVAALAAAADRLAGGGYDTRVTDPRIGPEFTTLTDAVNELAVRLADSERIRRRLMADLTHELRSPLAALEATVEAITDGVLPADATSLGTLAEQSARLHHLVADLESVSRAEERQLALHPRRLALLELARRAGTVLGSRYDAAGVRLTVEGDSPGPTVFADSDRLLEAVMNLLDNALRHTPAGGAVTIAVGAEPAAGPGPGLARLAVTDTGEGFLPEQAGQLFERFFRTDPARRPAPGGSGPGPAAGRRGSGIGLTITRAIVQAHHGEISAHSPGPGQGATFVISLPQPDRPTPN